MKSKNSRWTLEEHLLFIQYFRETPNDWCKIAEALQTRSPEQVKRYASRIPEEQKFGFRIGPWSPDEIASYNEAFRLHGKNWDLLSKMIKTRTKEQIMNYHRDHFSF